MYALQKWGPLHGSLFTGPATITEAGAIEAIPPVDAVVVPDTVPEHFGKHNPYQQGTKT